MKRITIERYTNEDPESKDWRPYSGLIEGETDSGRRWVLWLDHDGTPDVFWADREEDGTVVGEPSWLIPDDEGLFGKHAEQFAELVNEIGDDEPTMQQYHQIARLAYCDRTIYFRDEGEMVTCFNRRRPTVMGQGLRNEGGTGKAYWLYRKALRL